MLWRLPLHCIAARYLIEQNHVMIYRLAVAQLRLIAGRVVN